MNVSNKLSLQIYHVTQMRSHCQPAQGSTESEINLTSIKIH